MKVLAITTIPSGLDLQKNGIRYIDATLIDSDTGEVLDEFSSGILRLPAGYEDDIPLDDTEDVQLVDYSEAAANFREFMNEIALEFEAEPNTENRLTVVLDQDAGWVNAWLAYNGLEHIELTVHDKRFVVDYYSWLAGLELQDISRLSADKFDNSLDLARAFVDNNQKRLENKRKIQNLVNEHRDNYDYTEHLRSLLGAVFVFGCIMGAWCF